MDGERIVFICIDCGHENRYTLDQLIGRSPLLCQKCQSTSVERDSIHARQTAARKKTSSEKPFLV